MIGIAKRPKMLYIIICVTLCAVILSGCQGKKYEMIELPGTESAASGQADDDMSAEALDQDSETGHGQKDGLQSGGTAGADQAAESKDAAASDLADETGERSVPDLAGGSRDAAVRNQAAGNGDAAAANLAGGSGDAAASDLADENGDAAPQETESANADGRASRDMTKRGLSRSADLQQGLDAGIAPASEVPGEGGEAAAGETSQPAVPSNGKVVAIDAGHQAKGNSDKEPVGPGSTTMKAKVEAGATGVATGLKEYELTLAVSKKLKAELEARGYAVVMIRESNDVNISNAERARAANESGASAFVRIHGNSLDNGTVTGALTMCQTSGNPYNGALHDASYSLAKNIVDGICAATGAKNRGVQETDSMSGINWCQIPVSIVEMGFMSNADEDRRMADEAYQDQMVQGIANGIDRYFGF